MSYNSEVLADSPKVYYLLDETTGTSIADTSGNSHTATLVDAIVDTNFFFGQTGPITSDASNKAFNFSASPYLNLGNPADIQITGNITLEAWVKPHNWPSSGQSAQIISKGYNGTNEGYNLFLYNNSGTMELRVGSYDGTAYDAEWVITGWSLDTWKYIVGRYNGSAWQLLVDGTQVVTNNKATGAVATTSNGAMAAEYLAAGTGSPGRVLDGQLARPAIYATSLSDARVTAHYNAATGAGTPTISAITINSLGTGMVWTASASITAGAGGSAGAALTPSGRLPSGTIEGIIMRRILLLAVLCLASPAYASTGPTGRCIDLDLWTCTTN